MKSDRLNACVDKPKWKFRAVRKFGAALGHRCKISCPVHCNPPVQSFYWLDRSGTNMSASSTSTYSVLSSGNASTLTLMSVRQADYGNFTCVASNAIGNSSFRLALLPPGKSYLLYRVHVRVLARCWNKTEMSVESAIGIFLSNLKFPRVSVLDLSTRTRRTDRQSDGRHRSVTRPLSWLSHIELRLSFFKRL